MKKLLLLFIIVIGVMWYLQKSGRDLIPPFPNFPSSTVSTSSLSTTTVVDTIGRFTDQLKNLNLDAKVLNGFERVTTSPMRENYTTHMVSLGYPKNYFIRSIREAIVDGGIGEMLCSSTLKTGEPLTSVGQRIVAGVTVNKYTWEGAGAGNVYQGIIYSTKKGETCYATSLYLHTTQPENYANTEAEAKQFREEHDAAVKKIISDFENKVESFQFKK